MISQRNINAIEHIIFNSGAAQQFESALRGSRSGRPATFRHSLFLAGMLLAASTYKKTHITVIHKVLTEDLPLQTQMDWGIRQQRPTLTGGEVWVLSIDDLENVSRRILDRMNYTENRLPDRESPGDMADERARRYAQLTNIIDTLIRATHIPRPNGASDYALDSTGMWANERAWRALPDQSSVVENEDSFGPSEEEIIAIIEADQEEDSAPTERKQKAKKARKGGPTDAAFGAKTGKDGRNETYFGYEMHALVRVPETNAAGTKRTEPALVEAIRLTPAGRDIVNASLEVIDTVRATGQRITHLMTDRHYSFKKWRRWAQELIKRDVAQVVDLRVDDHGFKDWQGMTIVAGHPHCPSTPITLAEILKPELGASSEKWDVFTELIAERSAYATGVTKPMDEHGSARFTCPALAGTIGCPLRLGTIAAAQELGLPIVVKPPHPDEAPTLCSQNSVGLKITTDEQATAMKVHQKFLWGTPKWIAKYARRTFVEGWFGIFKGDTAAAKKRGSSLYVGLAHATLESTMFAAVSNVIALRSWHEETSLGDVNHPLLAQPEEPRALIGLYQDQYLAFIESYGQEAA